MEIKCINESRETYLDLLLIADEQLSMVEKYINKGDMFGIYDNDIPVCVCIIIQYNHESVELKNIVTNPLYQDKGYGSKMIRYLFKYYESKYERMFVGTGDSPLTIPFYENLGFTYSHRLKNFFIDNYDHPIIEEGKQLFDMIYLVKEL